MQLSECRFSFARNSSSVVVHGMRLAHLPRLYMRKWNYNNAAAG